jgi:hypothetical protein
MTSTHRTVTRIVRILESVARSGENAVGLAALARELDAPKSSVHGFVRGLCAEGYLLEGVKTDMCLGRESRMCWARQRTRSFCSSKMCWQKSLRVRVKRSQWP